MITHYILFGFRLKYVLSLYKVFTSRSAFSLTIMMNILYDSLQTENKRGLPCGETEKMKKNKMISKQCNYRQNTFICNSSDRA